MCFALDIFAHLVLCLLMLTRAHERIRYICFANYVFKANVKNKTLLIGNIFCVGILFEKGGAFGDFYAAYGDVIEGNAVYDPSIVLTVDVDF